MTFVHVPQFELGTWEYIGCWLGLALAPEQPECGLTVIVFNPRTGEQTFSNGGLSRDEGSVKDDGSRAFVPVTWHPASLCSPWIQPPSFLSALRSSSAIAATDRFLEQYRAQRG